MKDAVDTLRQLGLPLATLYLKVPDDNLLRERRTNEARREVANRIASEIRARRAAYLKVDAKYKTLSNTSAPFFDIDYRTVLKIIFKNYDKDLTEVPANKEFFILNKHIHVFERLFGFKFRDNKTLSAINNQSYVGMDMVYPETKEATPELTEPATLGKEGGNHYLERLEKKKAFRVFGEPSTVLSDPHSFHVG